MALTNNGNKIYEATAASDEITGTVYLWSLRWVSVASGADLIVTDTAGNNIWVSKADANNFVDMHPFFGEKFAGVKVNTIDDGVLYIYVKAVTE